MNPRNIALAVTLHVAAAPFPTQLSADIAHNPGEHRWAA